MCRDQIILARKKFEWKKIQAPVRDCFFLTKVAKIFKRDAFVAHSMTSLNTPWIGQKTFIFVNLHGTQGDVRCVAKSWLFPYLT